VTGFDVETRLSDYFAWLEDSTGQAMRPPESGIVDERQHREPERAQHSRRWLLAAACLVALLVAAAVVWTGDSDEPVWAAEAIVVAESAPRVLIDGWTVEGVGAFSADTGEVTFENGERSVDVFWTPGSGFAGLADDRSQSSSATVSTTADGIDWTVFDYGRGEYRAVALIEGHSVEVVAPSTIDSEFIDVLNDLEIVDVDTWLSALPASIVQPDSQAAVVEQMTADIAFPPGLARSDLTQADIVGNRTQVAIAVLGPLVCGWIDAWFAAKDAGDQQTAERAEEILGGARGWAIVEEMSEGPWFDSLLQRTDAVATGSLITDGSSPEPISRDNLAGIGCDPPT